MAQESSKPQEETATFAGGCFWCMEVFLDATQGVTSTIVGYTGGAVKNPTYEQVSGGGTGHVEAIQVTFDPAILSYEELLDIFWKHIDPTDAGGQFVDRGEQYKSAIFYESDLQKAIAEKSKEKVAKMLGKPVVTKILPAEIFYPAEEYHQEYYKKNPAGYERYDAGNGRKERLRQLWNKK